MSRGTRNGYPCLPSGPRPDGRHVQGTRVASPRHAHADRDRRRDATPLHAGESCPVACLACHHSPSLGRVTDSSEGSLTVTPRSFTNNSPTVHLAFTFGPVHQLFTNCSSGVHLPPRRARGC